MKITTIIYTVIAIAVLVFVLRDFFSETKGDHVDMGKKLKWRLGLPGFLMLVFFAFFTFLYSSFFWQ